MATTGIHLTRVFSPNSYGGAEPQFAPFTEFDSSGRAIGGYGPESIISSGSHSSYHALQSSLSKNSSRLGLGFQATYTYSKSLDDTSSVLGGIFGTAGVILQTSPQNPWNTSDEKGPSTFDVTHVFTFSAIKMLNLDKLGFLGKLPRPVTSGWQLLNITTVLTGSPLTFSPECNRLGSAPVVPTGRTWRKAPVLDQSRRARGLLWARRRQSFLLQYSHQRCRGNRTEPGSVRNLRP